MIFPTQGLNPGLLHYRQILYHLSHQGSPCELYLNQTLIKNLALKIIIRKKLMSKHKKVLSRQTSIMVFKQYHVSYNQL